MTSPDTMTSSDTRTDTGPHDAAETAAPSTGNRMIRILAALFAIIFICGTLAGLFEAHESAGSPPMKPVAIAVVALFAALGAWCLWVMIGNTLALCRGIEHMPSRERKSTWLTIAALAIGAVSGLAYSLTQGFAPQLIFAADGRILAPVAITVALIWGIGGPIITRWWLGQIDEHERLAYIDGANWAAHAMLFGVPIWWMLWKAGLASQPDAADCVVIAAFLWITVWFRRKFV